MNISSLGYCFENIRTMKHWQMLKRWLEGVSWGRNLSAWPLTCQRCTILLWWMLWSLQIELLLLATERCMMHNAFCASQNNAVNRSFWSVYTWLNQFPFKTIYLEQGSHTTWIQSKIKGKQKAIIIKVLTHKTLCIWTITSNGVFERRTYTACYFNDCIKEAVRVNSIYSWSSLENYWYEQYNKADLYGESTSTSLTYSLSLCVFNRLLSH